MEAKQDERFTVFGCFAVVVVAADAAVAAGNQAEEADRYRERVGEGRERQEQQHSDKHKNCAKLVSFV